MFEKFEFQVKNAISEEKVSLFTWHQIALYVSSLRRECDVTSLISLSSSRPEFTKRPFITASSSKSPTLFNSDAKVRQDTTCLQPLKWWTAMTGRGSSMTTTLRWTTGKCSTAPALISICVSVLQFNATVEHSEECTISAEFAFQYSILRCSKGVSNGEWRSSSFKPQFAYQNAETQMEIQNGTVEHSPVTAMRLVPPGRWGGSPAWRARSRSPCSARCSSCGWGTSSATPVGSAESCYWDEMTVDTWVHRTFNRSFTIPLFTGSKSECGMVKGLKIRIQGQNHTTSIGVTIPLFSGSESRSEITKKLKIWLRIRIQGRNHSTSPFNVF